MKYGITTNVLYQNLLFQVFSFFFTSIAKFGIGNLDDEHITELRHTSVLGKIGFKAKFMRLLSTSEKQGILVGGKSLK